MTDDDEERRRDPPRAGSPREILATAPFSGPPPPKVTYLICGNPMNRSKAYLCPNCRHKIRICSSCGKLICPFCGYPPP